MLFIDPSLKNGLLKLIWRGLEEETLCIKMIFTTFRITSSSHLSNMKMIPAVWVVRFHFAGNFDSSLFTFLWPHRLLW